MGSFNLAPLQPVVTYWFRQVLIGAGIDFAPYGQILEHLHAARGPAEGEQLATLVLLRPEDLLRVDGRLPEDDEPQLPAARAHLSELAEALAEPPYATSVIVALPPASAHVESRRALSEFDGWARTRVRETVERAPTTHLVPLAGLESLYGVPEVHDPFRDEHGHIPYSDEYLAALGTTLVRRLRASWEPARKVIALDCDNTLWGGACGEDDIESLVVDGPYHELRRFMRRQAESGRLLCLVSRNREADALDAVGRCAEPLEQRHIAAHRIRTDGPKSASLLSLSEELGLSPESFVFVDDDPLECAEVRAALPAVAVVELPADPAQIPKMLEHAWELDVVVVTDEDRRRTASYQLEARRRREQAAAPSLREFVEGLRVELAFHDLDRDNVERAAQILARTNQFNLTGARWSEQELLAASRRPQSDVLVIEVSDRLGNYGLVGVLVLERRRDEQHVAVLALSCRVLNRGVELEVLREAARRGRAAGCGWISIAFCGTGRNAPARAMLSKLLGEGGPTPEAEPRIDLDELPDRLRRLRPG